MLELVFAVAVSVTAAETKGKMKKKPPSPTAKFFAKLELTDAQKEQASGKSQSGFFAVSEHLVDGMVNR